MIEVSTHFSAKTLCHAEHTRVCTAQYESLNTHFVKVYVVDIAVPRRELSKSKSLLNFTLINLCVILQSEFQCSRNVCLTRIG